MTTPASPCVCGDPHCEVPSATPEPEPGTVPAAYARLLEATLAADTACERLHVAVQRLREAAQPEPQP